MFSPRYGLGVVAIILTGLLLAGCPQVIPNARYTNANLQGQTYATDLLAPGSAQDTAAEATDRASREIVEPDVYVRDGDRLYVLNQYRGLLIIDLASMTLLGQAPVYGYPRDLYVDGDRAWVLVSGATDYEVDGNTVRFDLSSRIVAVDLQDPAQPAIVGSLPIPGDLVDSRLVGDVLYAVSTAYQWQWDTVSIGVAMKNKTDKGSWITSVVLGTGAPVEADQVHVPGASTVIHVSSEALFTAASSGYGANTTFRYLDISDPAGTIVARGSAQVTGYVADRYKMDFSGGVLRAVSQAWGDNRSTIVSTLDFADPDAPDPMAALTIQRAQGDTLFATRFDGNRLYIVTYFIKDPLFVLDLSDPSAPVVLGELEVPGWSTHIEARGEHLLALGVDDTQGNAVAVSLFHVSGAGQPSLVNRVTVGSTWGWSSAYQDVKAFAVFDDLVVVPFSGWDEKTGPFDRLQFLSWSPAGLVAGGHVDVRGSVQRTIEHLPRHYGLTTEQLVEIDATDPSAPEVLRALSLADHTADAVRLENGTVAEIVTAPGDPRITVRTRNGAGTVLGQVSVELGDLVQTLAWGNSAILVGVEINTWDGAYDRWYGPSYGGRYRVARVECANPVNPGLAGVVSVDAYPWHDYWVMPILGIADAGGGTPGVVPGSPPPPGAKSIAMPWMPTLLSDPGVIAGDRLVLRCTADTYTSSVGSATPEQGLAVVNVRTLEAESRVGLGYPRVETVLPYGDKVAVAYALDALPGFGQKGPLVANHVVALSLPGGTAGSSANIPGIPLALDAASGLMILRDYQWNNSDTVADNLRTVTWDGAGGVQDRSSAALPSGASQVFARGGSVFADVYTPLGYHLHAYGISASGAIQAQTPVLVTEQWGGLLDAADGKAYVNVGGGAVAKYVTAGGLHLDQVITLSGYPLRLHADALGALAAMGHAGLLLLP